MEEEKRKPHKEIVPRQNMQIVKPAELALMKNKVKELPIDTGAKITVSKHDFEMLVMALEEKNKDIADLKTGILSALDMLGLVDRKTGLLDEGYLTGKKNIFKPILTEVTDVGLKLTAIMMRTPRVSKRYEAEMAEKFKFMKLILPILIKYGSTK